MKKESSRHVRRKRVPLLERDDGAGCEVPFGAAGGSAKRVVVRTLAAHGFSKKVTNQGGTAKTCLRPCCKAGTELFYLGSQCENPSARLVASFPSSLRHQILDVALLRLAVWFLDRTKNLRQSRRTSLHIGSPGTTGVFIHSFLGGSFSL